MKNKSILLVLALVVLGVLCGLNFSPLTAEQKFNGVTISQGVYFNCTPGQPSCGKKETLTHAWNQDLTYLKVIQFVGEAVPAMKTLQGNFWTEINPATNQYFKIPKKRQNPPVLDTSSLCQGSATGKTFVNEKTILGYRAFTYKDPANGWTMTYFPTLGCVGVEENTPMAASPGHVATTTFFVIEAINPSINQKDFDFDPGGMQHVLPSTLYHDRVYNRLVGEGKTPAEAESMAGHPRTDHGVSLLDKKWRSLHP
jgi:hypothetical protein